ncbi:MAG: hypothetical protein ILO36_07620, partial [Abditibacteriota bacterium]|nr:hypothetical protein [Abditibacteriota bacterium]
APEDAGPETEYAALPEEAPAGWSGMGRLLITFLVFIILSLVCYGVYRSSGPAPKPVPEPAAPAVINEPSVPEAKAPEKQPQKYAEGVFVSVKTFTWYPRTVIRIVVDDVVKYNQDTGPGACLEYTGKNYVKVYTDNGDHIQIRVNGRLEDSMGSPGKPVTKYYQVNTPETRPAE